MSVRPDLAALVSRLDGPPLTRFAPSPTGYLHLGHVVNAIYVWGVARALRGTVLLRIEDHDRTRSQTAFELALLEDLDWLGFIPDRGRVPLLRQSDRPHTYTHAVRRLRDADTLYACDCSRKDIGGERYRNTCRGRGLDERRGRGLRVEIDAGVEVFTDALHGRITQSPAEETGDLLVRDRDGNWTYQFAVTVDDDRDQVNLVIRGADLLGSTGRQMRLGRMLGRTAPAQFLHHPLLLKPTGQKLSKSNGDTGVRELRAAGMRPPEVIGQAASAVGLLGSPYPIEATDVVQLFE